jgi:PAS fold
LGAVALFLIVLVGVLLVEEIRLRRAIAALDRSEAANDALRHAIPDLMFVLSNDGVYLDYHALDHSALLVPPDQFRHRNFRDVLPPELVDLFERSLAQLRATGVPQAVEYAAPIGGTPRYFEARIVAFDATKVITVVRDITARRESALALQRAQAIGPAASCTGRASSSPIPAARTCLSICTCSCTPPLRSFERGLPPIGCSSRRTSGRICRRCSAIVCNSSRSSSTCC